MTYPNVTDLCQLCSKKWMKIKIIIIISPHKPHTLYSLSYLVVMVRSIWCDMYLQCWHTSYRVYRGPGRNSWVIFPGSKVCDRVADCWILTPHGMSPVEGRGTKHLSPKFIPICVHSDNWGMSYKIMQAHQLWVVYQIQIKQIGIHTANSAHALSKWCSKAM
jgi:hypothetical protein